MLRFEPARPEDIDTLFRLNKALIDEYEDLSSIDYPKVLDWVQANIRRHLAFFNRVLLDDALAGYYCLRPRGGRVELDSLFVLPPFRGQGIGTEILERCLSLSPGTIFLYVFRGNTRALTLYQRLGFRIVEEVGSSRYILEAEPCR